MRIILWSLIFVIILDGKHETKHGKLKKFRHALKSSPKDIVAKKAPAKPSAKESEKPAGASEFKKNALKPDPKKGGPGGMSEFHTEVIELPNLFGPLLQPGPMFHPHPPPFPHPILPAIRYDGKNKIMEHGPRAGMWGGECLCPDGRTYYVGDELNTCASIACEGGIKKSCFHRPNPKWSHRRVVCGGNPQDHEVYVQPHTYTYLGCFMDQEDRDLKTSIGKPYNADECHAKCARLGTPHFSLQDHGHCYCGTHESVKGKYDKLKDEECGQCPGPDCLGTVFKNAVYSVASQYVFMGCYVDKVVNRDGDIREDLERTMGGSNKKLQQCYQMCKNMGSPNFAMSLSKDGPGKCSCGAHTPGRFERRPDDECGECPGDACVGFRDRNAMYYIVNQYSFDGCYEDKADKPDLTDGTYSNFQHIECYTKCAGMQAKHFALSDGNKCHCGEHTDEYEVASTEYCGRDLRGGHLKNAVYTITYRGRLGIEQPSTIRTIVIDHESHSFFSSNEHGLSMYISWWHVYAISFFCLLTMAMLCYLRYFYSDKQKRFFRIWGAKEEGKSLLSENKDNSMYRGEIKPKQNNQKGDFMHL